MRKYSLILAGAILIASCAGKKTANLPVYLDPDKPLEERVEDALSRMTLEEKVAMTHAQSKEEGMQENQDNNDMLRDENTGRIFPGEGERNDMDLRESNHDIDQ